MESGAVDNDGRRMRRNRNRQQVIDTYIDLMDNGVLEPTRDELTAASGISGRSIYRYFPDDGALISAVADQDLLTTTTKAAPSRIASLLSLPDVCGSTSSQRQSPELRAPLGPTMQMLFVRFDWFATATACISANSSHPNSNSLTKVRAKN